jgi:ADP-heptose:LPS heptosyltransferase
MIANQRVDDRKGQASTAAPLVVRFGAIGDLVLLTPLLHLLHRRFGQPCRLLGSGGWMRPLLDGNPDIQAIMSLRSRRAPYLFEPSQWRLVAALRALPPGPVYVCDYNALEKVRWLLRRARIAPERCVYVSDMPRVAGGEHWVEHWLRFGESTPAAFGLVARPAQAEDRWLAPRLFVDAADRADLAQWLRARDLQGHPLILLQPGNKRTLKRGRLGQLGDNKTWPVERWASLARALVQRSPGARLVLCGAPAEAGLLREIQAGAANANVQVAADDLPLRRLLALLEIAQTMVSVDTGPAHMSAALGCPLVVLYGNAAPAHWLPRSVSGSDVLALGGPPVSTRASDIALDAVLAAWTRLSPRDCRSELIR